MKNLRFVTAVAVLAAALSAQPSFAGSFDALYTAANMGDKEEVLRWLAKGAEPDTADPAGMTLLMMAAFNGQVEMVDLLLKSGARPDLRNRQGDSALVLAALKGHLPVVERLVKAGAVLDQKGWTALHYAAFEGRTEVVNYLVRRGVNIDALAPNDSTALMLAARNGHMDTVQALLKAGATPDQVNHDGKTAATWARSTHNTDIADLLDKATADRKNQRIVVRVAPDPNLKPMPEAIQAPELKDTTPAKAAKPEAEASKAGGGLMSAWRTGADAGAANAATAAAVSEPQGPVIDEPQAIPTVTVGSEQQTVAPYVPESEEK